MKIISSKLSIINNESLFLWVFSTIWIIFSFIFLYLWFRDYNSLDNTARIVIPLIAILGMATLIPFSLSKNILKVTFDNETCKIEILKRFILSKKLVTFDYNDLKSIEIVETKDSEGDPYFNLNIYLKNDEFYIIKEGHHKETLEELMQKLLDFIKGWV